MQVRTITNLASPPIVRMALWLMEGGLAYALL
nr:MAG TPA: hypothetical protein [Caudoviricetes sp.]